MKSTIFNIDELKNKIQRSDKSAFRQLFDHFYPRLLNYSFVIVRNHESAEDIVLEALQMIWEQREKLERIDRLESYLYVCTKNKALDRHRKNSKLLNVSFSEPHYKEYITHQNPEIQFLNRELLEVIDRAILGLPEKTRLVYRLIKEDDLTYQEAADLLGVSVKTVNNQLVSAVKSIRISVTAYLSREKPTARFSVLKSLIFFQL